MIGACYNTLSKDGWAFLLAFTAPMWTLTGCMSNYVFFYSTYNNLPSLDDSAAHISEETAGAARAAPLAILIGVAGTASLGKVIRVYLFSRLGL